MSQFFYVHPETPQVRLMKQAVEIIKKGGVIIYPTDSGYALGCLMDNKHGLERIRHIRSLDKKHNFTLACRDLSEIANLEEYCAWNPLCQKCHFSSKCHLKCHLSKIQPPQFLKPPPPPPNKSPPF